MGHVYEGRYRPTGAPVAIKVLNADRSATDPTAVKRFAREARLLSAMRHPNVVRCFEHGIGRGGMAYIVMALVKGRTVEQLLEDCGPVSEPFALDVALQMCAALEQAHEHGIVHRDVKGANVIVNEEGGSLLVTLVDFGVGKRLSSASETDLTRPGHFVGSYKHCSPEQLTGEELDGRSDIYSLGVLLFEMLSGRPPFPSDSLEQLFMERLAGPVPRFQDVAPDAEVSSRTEEAVRRCLARQPYDRWHSVISLRLELEECRREARGDFVAPGSADDPHDAVTKTYAGRGKTTAESWQPDPTTVEAPGHQLRTTLDSYSNEPITELDHTPQLHRPPAQSAGAQAAQPLPVDGVNASPHDYSTIELSSKPPNFEFSTTLLAVVLAAAAVAFGVVSVYLLIWPV